MNIKKIYRLALISLSVLALYNCERDPYPVPDISETPIYQLYDISSDDIGRVDIYKEKPLFMVWDANILTVEAYSAIYTDNSTADTFKIEAEVTISEFISGEDGIEFDSIIYDNYSISAPKDINSDSLGHYTVIRTASVPDKGLVYSIDTSDYTMRMIETTVFN